MFDEFYDHPFIKSINNKERWTVVDKDKRPIDMFSFIYEHKINGAAFCDEKSLVSLSTLKSVLPNAANNTFYMDALTDNFVVLDIEPSCPNDIKQELIKLPYIYGEISLSGKGYHLIFPLPECINEYPIAKNKIVFKEPHKYYEILLNHYVTFTRNMLPDSVIDSTNEHEFEKLFRKMAEEQKNTVRTDFDIDEEEPDDIPQKDEILKILNNQKYKKTPESFFNDMSKYEYGHISFLYEKLLCILSLSDIKAAHDYTDTEKAWLLYEATKEALPYRDKHEESRNGLPWLMYLSQEGMAKNVTSKKE